MLRWPISKPLTTRSNWTKLKDKGDYKGLLALAKEYYDGNGMDEQHTYASPLQNRGDDLLIEDKTLPWCTTEVSEAHTTSC